ncbi:kinase-like domain-containing protein [Mycena rebaudengoi]|nr:kinase-like domain-containing protein [Mycena rebaudengoi]
MPDPSSSSVSLILYGTPFGTYPKDVDVAVSSVDLQQLGPPGTSVYRYPQEHIVVKIYRKVELLGLKRMWNVMDLAGDCCVSIVGRAFMHSEVSGFCMPIESPVDVTKIATKEERTKIIYQLRNLVARLHSKKIVHGDIKPANLLVCSDGQLRLCDFDTASIEGDGYTTAVVSYPYCSPFRVRQALAPAPMTLAEDLYAMGMTMMTTWEILENRCQVGFLPDMRLIDDPEIASMIETCLDSGPECSYMFFQDAVYCVETRFEFRFCTEEKKHLYSRVVHAARCMDRTDRRHSPCVLPFLERRILPASLDPTSLEPICRRCNPYVEYIDTLSP